jgi:hypothetical protein
VIEWWRYFFVGFGGKVATYAAARSVHAGVGVVGDGGVAAQVPRVGPVQA